MWSLRPPNPGVHKVRVLCYEPDDLRKLGVVVVEYSLASSAPVAEVRVELERHADPFARKNQVPLFPNRKVWSGRLKRIEHSSIFLVIR